MRQANVWGTRVTEMNKKYQISALREAGRAGMWGKGRIYYVYIYIHTHYVVIWTMKKKKTKQSR